MSVMGSYLLVLVVFLATLAIQQLAAFNLRPLEPGSQ